MTTEGFLGIDLGGSGAKAAVFDRHGKRLGFGQVAKSVATTPEGFTEIPIEEIYEAARQSVAQAVAASGARIVSLAVASQGQTFVSLDDRDRPLHSAIVWYDGRAGQQAKQLAAAVAAAVPAARRPVVEAIATAPKVLWLREHRPAEMSRARRFLLLPDYVAYRLTGRAVTDPNTADSTGLYAADAMDYCPEALAAAGIDKSQLASIQTPGTVVAPVLPAVAGAWGLTPDARVVTGTNDQYAGALGAGNCRPGIVSETTGTCLALVTLTPRLPDPLPPGMFGGRFPIPRWQFALAYAKTAGAVLEWFRRQFAPARSLAELDALAAQSPVGAAGLTVLPHFEGMVSPSPNPAARGAMRGLSLAHTLGDVYRAVLESLTFSLRENLEFLAVHGMPAERIRSIGGGAKSDFWLQMKADVSGLPVDRPAYTEAATTGAAMLAAAGAGAFASVEDSVGAFYHTARVFEPDPARRTAYDAPYGSYRRLCQGML